VKVVWFTICISTIFMGEMGRW